MALPVRAAENATAVDIPDAINYPDIRSLKLNETATHLPRSRISLANTWANGWAVVNVSVNYLHLELNCKSPFFFTNDLGSCWHIMFSSDLF